MAIIKKNTVGPSLYYATDKNIFDALNQHKVNSKVISQLFLRRNILISNKTPKEELAKYFSTLAHDYHDHQAIAARLGVASRRERTTSMEVEGIQSASDLKGAINQLKNELEENGDVVQMEQDGDVLRVRIQHTEIDYRRSEFLQAQIRDGVIEFIKSGKDYVVRNTQTEYINNVRDLLLDKADKDEEQPLVKHVISMFDIPSVTLRTKFFYELASSLPGFRRDDVTDVYIFKPSPDSPMLDAEEAEGDNDYHHVERVFLRGKGVSQSELLNELLDDEDYYIVKIGWRAEQEMGKGHAYEIEAAFSDIRDCEGFSFILRGVYPRENEDISSRKRTPYRDEIDLISKVVETRAREILTELRADSLVKE